MAIDIKQDHHYRELKMEMIKKMNFPTNYSELFAIKRGIAGNGEIKFELKLKTREAEQLIFNLKEEIKDIQEAIKKAKELGIEE